MEFGHIRKNCRARHAVCATCGKAGHSPDTRKADALSCVNCRRAHSAGNRGYPSRKKWELASQLRSESKPKKALHATGMEARKWCWPTTNSISSPTYNSVGQLLYWRIEVCLCIVTGETSSVCEKRDVGRTADRKLAWGNAKTRQVVVGFI